MNIVFVILIQAFKNQNPIPGRLELHTIATGWLRRKQAGFQDSLLLIGEEFPSVDAFKAFLKPYGLADADLAVIQDSYDEVRGERMEAVVEPWLDLVK